MSNYIPNRNWYQQVYLRSPHWERTKAEYKILVGWKCQRCFVRRVRLVHHLHYNSLGHEQPDDLLALCYECHEAMHRYPIAANDNRPRQLAVDEKQEELPFCLEQDGRKVS